MPDRASTAVRNFLTIAQREPPDAIFGALAQLAQISVGARLVSCSVFDRAKSEARRVYTNNPDVYPTSGIKPVIPNRWTETVLDREEVFVANSIGEIREVFPDHETIAQLGLGSIINLPVMLAGNFLGTVNLLDRPGVYDPDRVEAADTLRLPAMVAFSSLALANGET